MSFFVKAVLAVPGRSNMHTLETPVMAVNAGGQQSLFVEFRHVEDADIAICMDGVVFKESQLRIRRPKDYVPPLGASTKQWLIPGLVATNVLDGPNKIYIGNIPTALVEGPVQELLRSFGPLKSFNLVKDPHTGASKGYAFCEFADPAQTDVCIQGLHGVDIAGQPLLCRRATGGAVGTVMGPGTFFSKKIGPSS